MSDLPCAVTALVRGEVFTACSEKGASGSEGRVGGERRKEFLRMPGKKVRQLYLIKAKGFGSTFRPLGW